MSSDGHQCEAKDLKVPSEVSLVLFDEEVNQGDSGIGHSRNILDSQGNMAFVSPSEISWNTPDAIVAYEGNLFPVSPGTFKISYVYKGVQSNEVEITILPQVVNPVPDNIFMELNTENYSKAYTLAVGENKKLTLAMQNSQEDNRQRLSPIGISSWASSDLSVASVDNFGVITAHSVGVATITATASNPMASFTSDYTEITVVSAQGEYLNKISPEADIALSMPRVKGAVKAKIAGLNSVFNLGAGEEGVFSFESQDLSKVMVDSEGIVSVTPGATQGGNVFVTVKFTREDGAVKSKVYLVRVYTEEPVIRELTISGQPFVQVHMYSQNPTIPKIIKEDQLGKKSVVSSSDVIWTSSDTSLVTVDAEGALTYANTDTSQGQSVITATSKKDATVSVSYQVNFYDYSNF